MGGVASGSISIPERVLGLSVGKELTPISTDIFISIPHRVRSSALYRFPQSQLSKDLLGSDIFDVLNNSETYWLDITYRISYRQVIRVINLFVLFFR